MTTWIKQLFWRLSFYSERTLQAKKPSLQRPAEVLYPKVWHRAHRCMPRSDVLLHYYSYFKRNILSFLGFIDGFSAEGNIKMEGQIGHKRKGENVLIPWKSGEKPGGADKKTQL